MLQVLVFNQKLLWSCPERVHRVPEYCPVLVLVPLERGFVPVSASEHQEQDSHRVPGLAVLAAIDSREESGRRLSEEVAIQMDLEKRSRTC